MLDWIEGELLEHNNTDLLSYCKSIREKVQQIAISKMNYGLVHYDFELDNIFYSKKNMTVIDFDDGMYSWYALDIEQAYDVLSDINTGEELEKWKREFLSGYKSEYDIEDEMLSRLPLFRKFIDLYSYIRVRRCVEEKWRHEPDWMVELRSKLNLYLENSKNEMLKNHN